MKTIQKSFAFILTLILIAFFPVKAPAMEKIRIKPMVTVSAGVEDNYFKSETNEREVYVYEVKPSIELGYETDRSLVLLDYTLSAFYYQDKDDAPEGQISADEHNYLGHSVLFGARIKPFERLTLGLNESYYITRDPTQANPLGDPAERHKYTINRFTPSFVYEFENRFSVGTKFRNTNVDYDPSQLEDSKENRGIFDVLYHFSETASLDLNYQYWQKNYSGLTSDYVSNQAQLIFRKQFHYVTFGVGGGYHLRTFDDEDFEDLESVTYRFTVDAQNPPPGEGTPTSYARFLAESNYNDSGLENKYYQAYKFSLDAGHIFFERLPVNILASYRLHRFEDVYENQSGGEEREDNLYAISGSIGYKFLDWLTLSAVVGYEGRESNFTGYDYDNTFFLVKIDSEYDFAPK